MPVCLIALLAHSPLRPSWPHVRMLPSGPRPSSIVHSEAPERAVPLGPEDPVQLPHCEPRDWVVLVNEDDETVRSPLGVIRSRRDRDLGGVVSVHLVKRERLGDNRLRAVWSQVSDPGDKCRESGIARRQLVLEADARVDGLEARLPGLDQAGESRAVDPDRAGDRLPRRVGGSLAARRARATCELPRRWPGGTRR